jgi:hypothetical protein
LADVPSYSSIVREREDQAVKDLFLRVTTGGLKVDIRTALPIALGVILTMFPATFAGWANELFP